jgi:membrane fusion protein, adhesin transport system
MDSTQTPAADDRTVSRNKRNSHPRFQSLEMVKTPPTVTLVISLLIFFIVGTVAAALFLPWRQSITGAGKIIVFSPMHRPQPIAAQIPGRLLRWFVRDGDDVKSGQPIVELAEVDSRFLDDDQMSSLLSQKKSLVAKRTAAEARLEALTQQEVNSAGSRTAAVPAASERMQQARDRVMAAEQNVEAAKQSLKTAEWQFDRMNSLYEDGLRSKRDKELAELDKVKAQTDVERSYANLDVAKEDAKIATLERSRTQADTGGSINAVEAAMADAKQIVAATNADIYKLEIDINNFSKRVGQRKIVAPCEGRIVRLMRVGTGETLNAGEVLAVIAPKTEDRAAELTIRDWDAPLVSVGRPVRLQIAGWPALQFIGWPRIAIGTFAGKVSVIDPVDDGKSRFRIIVVPDVDAIARHETEPWPSGNYLRPGAQVSGWVLLSDVPLWYELWRQFNGWQPTVTAPETTPQDQQSKDKRLL